MTKKSIHLFITLVIVLLGCALPANAQRVVKGLVVDAEGTPLPGVNVVVRGKEINGTTTSIDGKYAITAAPKDSITFSYIGFTTVSKYVGNNETIDVILKEDAKMLDENGSCGFCKAEEELRYRFD